MKDSQGWIIIDDYLLSLFPFQGEEGIVLPKQKQKQNKVDEDAKNREQK